MTYHPSIHHRKSIRLKGYDYSQTGLYFFTICVHNRARLFVQIMRANNQSAMKNSPNHPSFQMMLNDAGQIANQCWLDIPKHFPNVVLHEHIIMPDHIHGIIEIVGANQHSTDILSKDIHSVQSIVKGAKNRRDEKKFATTIFRPVSRYPLAGNNYIFRNALTAMGQTPTKKDPFGVFYNWLSEKSIS